MEIVQPILKKVTALLVFTGLILAEDAKNPVLTTNSATTVDLRGTTRADKITTSELPCLCPGPCCPSVELGIEGKSNNSTENTNANTTTAYGKP